MPQEVVPLVLHIFHFMHLPSHSRFQRIASLFTRPHLALAAAMVLCLGLAGCASPNSSEREARAGDSDMRQDVYRSQIEGFEYRAVVTENDLRAATLAAGNSPINSTDAERRARNYLTAAYPLRQSLVVQSVIQMPLIGTELPREVDPDHKALPMTYFVVSLRSTHKPRYPQDVDMIKMIVYPNGQIVPFRAKGRWIS